MIINLINPNTSESMTNCIAQAAKLVAAPDTQLRCCHPEHGAKSIEGFLDELVAATGVIEQIQLGEQAGCQAHIIACFGDPGLDAGREVASVPVIGIAEAAMHTATLLGHRFSVVTSLCRTVAMTEHLLVKYGMEQRCASVRAVDIAVLDLHNPESDAYRCILEACQTAVHKDQADAIVLGCAGMADLQQNLSQALGIPVIDGVASALGMAEMLIRCGLSTGKQGCYAAPLTKVYSGWASSLSPSKHDNK